jgi:hypothetical protein
MAFPPGIPAPVSGSQSPSRRAAMVVLAYLWPLAIAPLLMCRGDEEVSWHARQGLLLMAAELPLLIVLTGLTALTGLANYGVGVMVGLILLLAWAAVLVLQLTAILYALNGKRLVVPGISHLADRLAGK